MVQHVLDMIEPLASLGNFVCMGCVYARMINGDFGGLIWWEEIFGVIGIGEENTPFERGLCTLDMGRSSLLWIIMPDSPLTLDVSLPSAISVAMCVRPVYRVAIVKDQEGSCVVLHML